MGDKKELLGLTVDDEILHHPAETTVIPRTSGGARLPPSTILPVP